MKIRFCVVLKEVFIKQIITAFLEPMVPKDACLIWVTWKISECKQESELVFSDFSESKLVSLNKKIGAETEYKKRDCPISGARKRFTSSAAIDSHSPPVQHSLRKYSAWRTSQATEDGRRRRPWHFERNTETTYKLNCLQFVSNFSRCSAFLINHVFTCWLRATREWTLTFAWNLTWDWFGMWAAAESLSHCVEESFHTSGGCNFWRLEDNFPEVKDSIPNLPICFGCLQLYFKKAFPIFFIQVPLFAFPAERNGQLEAWTRCTTFKVARGSAAVRDGMDYEVPRKWTR